MSQKLIEIAKEQRVGEFDLSGILPFPIVSGDERNPLAQRHNIIYNKLLEIIWEMEKLRDWSQIGIKTLDKKSSIY